MNAQNGNSVPVHVEIVEVSPRDGLQSDDTAVSTADKVDLITRAVRSGIRRIETVSFVNPKRVPQMADAAEVMSALLADTETRALGASYIGLVLNERGLDRALETGVDEINVVVVCTDTFAEKNQGQPTEALIAAAGAIAERAAVHNLRTSVTLAASFGCPYEGEVSIERFESVVAAIAEFGVAEIALADSIGVAAPNDVEDRVAASFAILSGSAVAKAANTQLRCHFHNTRNTGLANAVAAVRSGVRVIDASLGGVGGCPFAPNATGNIPTEDVIYLLHRMGYSTGVDVDALCESVPWIESVLDHSVPGYLAKAGNFPGDRGR
jgi:hydroxymethylglutaryl-CoA lyase